MLNIKPKIDAYRLQSLGDEEVPLGPVSSITEGDITTSFRGSTALDKDTLIKDYKVQLIRYRKLVW